MKTIDIVNADCIDREYDDRHGGVRYFWIRYAFSSFLVGKEYPAFSLQDAIDTLADWLPDHAPGYLPSAERIAELEADAIRDGRDDPECYIEDFYMRAGNASEWIETPAMADEISEVDLLAHLAEHGYTATIDGNKVIIE